MTSYDHRFFVSPLRDSQSLSNDRCQNVLYKAVFEHFTEIKDIAALLLASKSFQNSSFGANFLVNYVVEDDSILLLESVLSPPSSCFSLQFVPSLHVKQWTQNSKKISRGITNFVRELASTKYLHLSLRSIKMETISTKIVSRFFGSSLNGWPQLQNLSLEGCAVDDNDLEIISKNALQLRSVNLSKNPDITDVGLNHIANISGITDLDLSYCNKITDVGLVHISKLSYIGSLTLSCCRKITDVGLEHISKLSATTSLNLSHCFEITDAGLEHLSKLVGITDLDLSCCTKITDVGLEHVSKLSGLSSVELWGCSNISAAGEQRLRAVLSRDRMRDN